MLPLGPAPRLRKISIILIRKSNYQTMKKTDLPIGDACKESSTNEPTNCIACANKGDVGCAKHPTKLIRLSTLTMI